MALQAKAEFDAAVTNGSGTAIATLVGGFSTNGNHMPLNLGQLKYLAEPFYDRLAAVGWTNAFPAGMTGSYPWTATTTDDVSYALVNLGQLKYVFSFDPEACMDSDGDGLSDRAERALGYNPNDADTDHDGMADGWEVTYGFDPLNSSDASGDSDSDGYANLEEYQLGMDPSKGVVDGPAAGVNLELYTVLTD